FPQQMAQAKWGALQQQSIQEGKPHSLSFPLDLRRFECPPAKQQPEVSETFPGAGRLRARFREHFVEVNFVVVRSARVCALGIKAPEVTVGDDDPRRSVPFKQTDHDSPRVFGLRFLVPVVLTVERSAPWI